MEWTRMAWVTETWLILPARLFYYGHSLPVLPVPPIYHLAPLMKWVLGREAGCHEARDAVGWSHRHRYVTIKEAHLAVQHMQMIQRRSG